MQTIQLQCRAGSSDKEYHVQIEPRAGRFVVNVAYGRRGSTLTTGTKTAQPVDSATAERIFRQVVKEKKAKGYQESQNGTLHQHVDRNESHLHCQLLNPITAEEASALMADDRWCVQEKKDGRRMLLEKRGDIIRGINRKGLYVGLPVTVQNDAKMIPADCVLDGECVGDVLHVFDLLIWNGHDLRPQPYQQRLELLTVYLSSEEHPHLTLVPTARESAEKLAFLELFRKEHREGIVCKRLDAPYVSGRPNTGGSQLKYKFWATLSAVVTKLNPQRSVAVSLVDPEGWHEVGNVTVPANHAVPLVGTVIEVQYLYAFRESGCLFQPVYRGERTDVEQLECTMNQRKFQAAGGES